MKHLLYTFVLLISILGCSKFEGEYTINCQFTPNYGKGYLLLVTNYKGDIIGKFDIPEGSGNFSDKLLVTDENAPEYYHLHLIDTGECYTHIYSHLAVPNGALVHLNPKSLEYSYTTNTYTQVRIDGIESLDSLHWVGWNIPTEVNFSQAEKNVNIGFYRERTQGIILRLRANGEPQFRTLFIADTEITDTVNLVHWQDFQAETNPVAIELPDNQPIQFLDVDGITTDFRHSVKIVLENGWNSTIAPQFFPPANPAAPLAYRVSLDRPNDKMQQIFMPGEPIRFEATDMRIDEFSTNDRKVNVKTSGDVDLIYLDFIKLQSVQNQQLCGYFWGISGAVDAFEHIELPNLDAYLPQLPNAPTVIKSYSVIAYQFGRHDYPQIREGFPYKSTEPFAVARSGYRAIRRDY